MTEVKKSQAMTAFAWLRTKVAQCWFVTCRRRGPESRYLRTVRGETLMPSLMLSSLAMRSSPQIGLSRSIAMMRSRRFCGSGGRPSSRDIHCQNAQNALRCHLMKVSGLTITSASRQWKKRASVTRASRNNGAARPA